MLIARLENWTEMRDSFFLFVRLRLEWAQASDVGTIDYAIFGVRV